MILKHINIMSKIPKGGRCPAKRGSDGLTRRKKIVLFCFLIVTTACIMNASMEFLQSTFFHPKTIRSNAYQAKNRMVSRHSR